MFSRIKSVRLVLGLAAILIVLAAGGGVYFAVSTWPRIPVMPRAAIDKAAEEEARKALDARTASVEFDDREGVLVSAFERLNREELKRQRGERDQTEELNQKLRAAAVEFASRDEQRYLLVGDVLARRFEAALFDVLKAQAIEKTPGKSGQFEVLDKLGGTFFSRFIKRGAIQSNGQLRTSHLVPAVLFRARWRDLSGLPVNYRLHKAEQKAYFDFVAAFGNPQDPYKRLAAISALKRIDRSYDADIAGALVLYQAGRSKQALKKLHQAIERGRRDRAILSFQKELQR